MKNETNEFSFIVRLSTIPGAGVGVFALHDVVKGTKLDLMPDGLKYKMLQAHEVPKELLGYCVADEGGGYRCPADFNRMEIAWYINHSTAPNVEWRVGECKHYALSDIQAGDELLLDYNSLKEPEDKKEEFYR